MKVVNEPWDHAGCLWSWKDQPRGLPSLIRVAIEFEFVSPFRSQLGVEIAAGPPT